MGSQRRIGSSASRLIVCDEDPQVAVTEVRLQSALVAKSSGSNLLHGSASKWVLLSVVEI